MSKPERTPDYPGSSPEEIAKFYQSLGELNTKLVGRIILHPEAIAEVIEFIGTCVKNVKPEECEQGYVWNGVQCVRQ